MDYIEILKKLIEIYANQENVKIQIIWILKPQQKEGEKMKIECSVEELKELLNNKKETPVAGTTDVIMWGDLECSNLL